nr:intercellular adhesion molecule 4 [Anolis sagrei ordinatus]
MKAICPAWVPFMLLAAVIITAGTAKVVFEVTLSPRMVAVKRGGSVWLNCSSTCNSTEVVLETSLPKGKEERGPGWMSTELQDITKQTSFVHCYQTCEGESKNASATILTYDPPEHVFMKLEKSSSSQNIHQTYNLTCRVIKITPVRNLSVILMKGAKRVHSCKLQNYAKSGTKSFNITHAIALRPHDHGQEATCQVTLDLNAEEPVLIATSSKLELKTPETYRGVIAAISAISMLATVLLGIFIYLVLARGSPQL